MLRQMSVERVAEGNAGHASCYFWPDITHEEERSHSGRNDIWTSLPHAELGVGLNEMMVVLCYLFPSTTCSNFSRSEMNCVISPI